MIASLGPKLEYIVIVAWLLGRVKPPKSYAQILNSINKAKRKNNN